MIDPTDLVVSIFASVVITAAIAIPVTHGCTSSAYEQEAVAIGAAEYVMPPNSKCPKWQWKVTAEKKP